MKMLCKGRMPDVLRKELVVPSASIAALVFRVVALFHPLWSLLKTEVAPFDATAGIGAFLNRPLTVTNSD